MGLSAQEQKKLNERVPRGYIHLVKEVADRDDPEQKSLVNQYVPPINVDVHIDKYDFEFASEEEKQKYVKGLRADGDARNLSMIKKNVSIPKWLAKAPVYVEPEKKTK